VQVNFYDFLPDLEYFGQRVLPFDMLARATYLRATVATVVMV
jgi:hypothetical protein